MEEEVKQSRDHAPHIGSVTSGQSHTPGPWKIDGRNRTNDGWCLYSPDGYGIGCVWDCNGNPENEANARLIAAAPDLYEALKRLIPTNINLNHPALSDETVLPCDVTLGELRAAAAALSKASALSQLEHKEGA